MWILSSYDTPDIRELFDGYGIVSIQSSSGMKTSEAERRGDRKRTVNQEILITNFTPPVEETPFVRVGSTKTQERVPYGQFHMFPDGSVMRDEGPQLDQYS